MTTPSSERPRLTDALEALRIRDFRRFWLAGLASNSGSWLQGLASPFVMYEITESGAWVGASVFALMLPMALMGPLAGPLADRKSRRDILRITQALLAVVATMNAVLWWTGVREPLAYIAVNVVYGIVNGFSMPAWQSYVSDLVPRTALMNAITLNSTQFNAARAIGPSIGGVVLATLGPGWSFFGNGMSFLIVLATLFTLPQPPPSPHANRTDSALSQFGKGLAYARTQPTIMTGYLAAGLTALLGATLVQVHLVLFIEEVFMVGELKFGIMASVYGVGAVAVAPWLAAVGPSFRRSRMLVGGLVLYGASELLLTATTSYWVGLAAVALIGCAHLVMATTTNTTLQLHVPEAVRGRVMAMYLMVFTLGAPIGALVQGPLAEAFGPRKVVAVMGSLLVGSALLLGVTGRAKTFDLAGADPADEPAPRAALPDG